MKWQSDQKIYEMSILYKDKLPIDFNWKQYVLLNPDLEDSGITNEQYAIEHYIIYGIKEKRQYKLPNDITIPNDFNSKIYKYLNPDIYHLTDLQATQHFINHGMLENRKYLINFTFDSNFDPRLYKIYNPDLINLTDLQAVQHYMHHGYTEGRTFYTGISYDTLIKEKNNQTIESKDTNCVLLINHDASLTGAPIFLYDLYDYLVQNKYFTKIIMVDPYPNNVFPQYSDKLYHFNDPQKLIEIIEKLDPVLIYSNSLNLYVRNLSIFYYWIYKTIFHFHETYEPFNDFIDKKVNLQHATIKVVSDYIKKEYLQNQNFKNIEVFPPFIPESKLNIINEKSQIPCTISNAYGIIDQNKIIIGMSGSICDRKNFLLFYNLAKSCPEYEFLWIGGQYLDQYLLKTVNETTIHSPTNFYWVPNTKNPYQYFKYLDYFLLTSKSDPCPIVILENLYLNKKIIVLKNNIHTKHNINLLENFIELDNTVHNDDSNTIIKFKRLNLNKNKNITNKNSDYIEKYFSKPNMFHDKKIDQNNFIIVSIYINQHNYNLNYLINLINQFIIRNNYSYKTIISLSFKDKSISKNINILYKYIINLEKIIIRNNIGYDIGGLLDGIKYIYEHLQVDEHSQLAYIHNKSNIHWRNINDQIFYLDNIPDIYGTISSKRFTTVCDNNDLNRPIFVKYPNIFNQEIIDKKFTYIQGTVFRTNINLLKTLFDKYDIIYPNLTNIDTNDEYWISVMKNKELFDNYLSQYTNNIFNKDIDKNSFNIINNNMAKNYIELYHKYNIRGIPDCQIEHALERYIGYLITNNIRVYQHE